VNIVKEKNVKYYYNVYLNKNQQLVGTSWCLATIFYYIILLSNSERATEFCFSTNIFLCALNKISLEIYLLTIVQRIIIKILHFDHEIFIKLMV